MNITKIIKKVLQPFGSIVHWIIYLLFKDILKHQEDMLKCQNDYLLGLVRYNINNSIFRLKEYEDSYLEMADILNKAGIEWSLFGGALLTVVRNGYLDPNTKDIDYITLRQDVDKLLDIFLSHPTFHIHTQLFCEDERFGYHIYDVKRNILHDFYSVDKDGHVILTGDGPYSVWEAGIPWGQSFYLPYHLYDHKEFFDGICLKEFQNTHTGSKISFPILNGYSTYLYKIYGEEWLIRINVHKDYYAVTNINDRKSRGGLILTAEKPDKEYKMIRLLHNDRLRFIWSNHYTEQ